MRTKEQVEKELMDLALEYVKIIEPDSKVADDYRVTDIVIETALWYAKTKPIKILYE